MRSGRSRLGLLMTLICFWGMLWGCKVPDNPKPQISGPETLAYPNPGIYVGAYIDFGEAESEVTLEAIEQFEKMVKKHQAVIASSSFWGEQSFPDKTVKLILRHHAIPLIFWSPWDQPYVEGRPPDRFSLEAVIAGSWDAYIDRWADAAKEIGRPLLVSWGLEMNGNWFPWSGAFYGAGTPVGSEFKGPETYKRAFRHVVDRVRARGACNILWGFHVNNATYPDEPWNQIDRYYPGSDYVDWLGLSTYGKQFIESPWVSFDEAMDLGYSDLCLLDAAKPVLLAEWGVGEFPVAGNKAEWIAAALQSIRTRYSRVKLAVYWHERWLNANGYYSNLRLNSSPEALAAYQRAIADPFWLDKPQFLPRTPDRPGCRR